MPDPYADNTPVGYVTNFYVTPSQRNKRAGSALLKALKQHSRSSGFDTLIVWPSERSSPLWQRSGLSLHKNCWNYRSAPDEIHFRYTAQPGSGPRPRPRPPSLPRRPPL